MNRSRRSMASSTPGVRFYDELATVLADPSIDAVALATPAVTHYEMAKAALEAGKDVFVEKPLAVDVEQGEELVELAQAKGRILMVGHILRYHPAILKLQAVDSRRRAGQDQLPVFQSPNIGKIRTEENILWSFAPHDISVMLVAARTKCRRGVLQGRRLSEPGRRRRHAEPLRVSRAGCRPTSS